MASGSLNTYRHNGSATINEKSSGRTFKLQMSPTLSLSSESMASFSASTSSSSWPPGEVCSFSPRSLARCSRHMKQKLVLISSILSFGYDFWRPEITELKTRCSSGLVRDASSTSYGRVSRKVGAIQKRQTILSSSSSSFGFPTLMSKPFQIFSFNFLTSTRLARLA